ncbi:YceI family protein [Amycolatopsis balhimycina DSM 5908]|uniref:YceI family protein n=1 Tax=Amycolatopsis balhimycina DSM 5908 TaxID=1081091 RepID=A0A428WV37_AMYBA|nr:YceI family protein [Amycolatopsis balhimycina]RSM46954.1 YceI family protein [Amycolatopsis balhimycina DSM 5908]
MTAAFLTIEALDAHVPVGTWTIDPAHSSVGFSVRHLMGKVRGTFEEFTGHLRIAEQPAGCSATATIAMGSVNTANRMRDDDLRSAGFFDAGRHPDLTFEGAGLIVRDGGLELPGKLTIRGITRDVAMEVEFLGLDETGLQGEQRIGISATTTIRRSDYGVGAAAGEGQKIVVGDKITIQLDIQAVLGT